jgi:hypothetical protein
VALATAALALTAGSPALSRIQSAQSAHCRGHRLLPDLASLVPFQVDVKQEGAQFLLVFETGVVNQGAGPLTLVGVRSNPAQPQLGVRQLISCAAGPPESHPGAGVMRYSDEPSHQHWHYLDFEQYELRGPAPATGARRSRKAGFCPADVVRPVLPVPLELAAAPAGQVFQDHLDSKCGGGQRAALRVETGISVGWADLYAPYVEGQFIDVTGLGPGSYRLTNEVNPRRVLLEQRYDDDMAGVTLTLSWPTGPQSMPRVATGAPCLGRSACSQ